MNKFLGIIILVLVLALSISINAENLSDIKEIEFWTINLSPDFDDYFLNKISEYEENNPGVKIIWEDINFSSINQQLRYRIAEGKIPEVVNLSPQLMESLLLDGLLYPISKFEADYSREYYPLLWENAYYQGEYYAFPWYLSSRLMAYNQEIFKIAGVDPASALKSRKELFSAAEIISEKTGVYSLMPQIKIQNDFLEAGINLFKEEKGSLKAAFNTEAAADIIRSYQMLVKKEVIPRDSITSNFNIALERYQKNDLAILFIPAQFLKIIDNQSEYLKDVTALAAIPKREGGVINASLMNLVIPEGADNKESAADFAHFITSAKSQEEFSQRAAVLSSAIIKREGKSKEQKDLIDGSEVDSLEAAAVKILEQQLPQNKDLTLIHPQSGRLLKIMEEQFQRAFLGKITAEEALNIMEEKWNQILAEGDK